MSSQRRARKKVETRQRIVEAGIEVLSRKGIEHATVDDIAAAADVGKGTIYNYFKTKQEIVIAFLADVEREVQREAEPLVDHGASLESILTRFVRLQLEVKQKHYRFVRVFLGLMFTRTDASMPWLQELQTVVDPPLERLFAELRARGLIRADVEIPLLVQVFKTVQLGITALWAVEGPPWEGTALVIEEEIRLFCRGLQGNQT